MSTDLDYWRSYKAGLEAQLKQGFKYTYYGKEVGERKKPIGEIQHQLTQIDKEKLQYEIVKVDAIISAIKSITWNE